MKPDGGIRGIATSTSFRRLVSKSLARQFMKNVEDACSPFQFALSTRAGTDCVAHAVGALIDLNPDRTVMSIDGIGAYDHVFRSVMLAKLHDEPRLHGLLPFVRALYSERSCHWWRDSEAPNMAGRRWGTGRPSDAPALQPCHSRFITGREARHATRRGVVCVPR